MLLLVMNYDLHQNQMFSLIRSHSKFSMLVSTVHASYSAHIDPVQNYPFKSVWGNSAYNAYISVITLISLHAKKFICSPM